jgi:hypothetical protein
MEYNTGCKLMYLSDYMKHHRGSRNLADDIANVINNLKRKRILGL